MFYFYVGQQWLAWPCANGSRETLECAKAEAGRQLDDLIENGGGEAEYELAQVKSHIDGKFVEVATKKFGEDWVDLEIA